MINKLKIFGMLIISLIVIVLFLHPVGFGIMLLYDSYFGAVYKIRKYWVGVFSPSKYLLN